MRKTNNGDIKLADIRFVENSRMRGKDDVSDLMRDIEQHGLLEPVGIRKNDNSIIFGNRRVAAFKKLGYDTISCVFFEDVSDEDLLILNVVENIKRKSIGSVELGRMCKLLEASNMTKGEIAIKFGMKRNRISSCIAAYEVTKGTPFEKLIEFGQFGPPAGRTKIPEGIIWKIQTTLARSFPGRKVTKQHWKILLPELETGKVNSKNMFTLRGILSQDPDRDLAKAIEILSKVKMSNIFIPFSEDELRKAMHAEKFSSEVEFVKYIIKQYNSKLLF